MCAFIPKCHLWTIYVSGFSNDVAGMYIGEITRRFHNLNLKRIANMRRVNAKSLPIRNQRKADAFLKGCKLIEKEGWRAFKRQILRDGTDALAGLPFLGPANTQLMALALGIADTEKADTWMKQCAEACNAKSVEEMVDYLAGEFGVSRVEVDSTLWRYCRENRQIPQV